MILWDWKAKSYDLLRNLFPFKYILKKELCNIKEFLTKFDLHQGPILDMGTGTGTILKLFPNDSKVLGLDKSIGMIKRARLKRDTNFVVGDSLSLPFKSFTFELVTAVGLFEYSAEQNEFLRELQRVTTPGAFVILTFSQINLLNIFRYLLAHRLYLITLKNFIYSLERTGYTVIMIKKSLLQRQVLIHKKCDNLNDKNKTTISKQ